MLRRVRGLLRRLSTVRYDSRFFTEGWFKNWAELAPVLLSMLTLEQTWRAYLDYGCGPGVMIDPMNDRGFRYIGCDVSPQPRQLYLQRFGKYPDRYVASLEEVAGQRFDVLVMFDVLEHLRNEEVTHLLQQARGIPEVLANISREPGIPGHINIQSDASWIEFFRSEGWSFDEAHTKKLRHLYLTLRPAGPDLWHRNLFLFRRRVSEAREPTA